MDNQFVILQLAEEYYGVAISMVESIVKMQPILSVPYAPNFVEGITNLRDRVLPVIDLRKRFNLPVQETTKDSRIVVVMQNGAKAGMIVDGVSEVLTILEEEIEMVPEMATTVDSAYINGVAKIGEHLIILLDLGAVLSTPEQARLEALPDAL